MQKNKIPRFNSLLPLSKYLTTDLKNPSGHSPINSLNNLFPQVRAEK